MTELFLTPHFLFDAIKTPEKFHAALARLNAQKAAVNSNLQRGAWNFTCSPIKFVLDLFVDEAAIEAYHERSAQLIEAMYVHCGVPLSTTGTSDGDVGFAMHKYNFSALEVLLRKCKGVFPPTEQPMDFIQSRTSFTKMLPLLRMLLRLRDILPKEILDPNVLYYGTTALHQVVRCDYCHATDPDPRVAQLLIRGFGANPLLKDASRRTPLDLLTKTAALVSRAKFPTKTAYADWQARVAATKEILRRDRDVAVLMCQSTRNHASPLHQLQSETLRYIVEHANQRDRDADDLSS
jgi:hypothetical protein